MARIAAFLIFGIMLVAVYLLIELAFPQWFDWTYLYDNITVRLNSESASAVAVLSAYLLLALWVLIGFGRWMAGLAIAIVTPIQNFFSKKEEGPENQTLDNTLIIDSPKLKKPIVRFFETVFSAVVWLFFVYLFQTIVTTILWILGMERIYDFNFSQTAIQGTVGALILAAYAAVISIAVLFLWARWNIWRFGKLNRRQPAPVVSADEVAMFFSLPVATVLQIQSTKIMAIMPIAGGGLDFQEIKS